MSLTKGRQTKEFSDIFTPSETARQMAESLRPYLAERKGQTVRVLEPSAGTGNLLWPLIKVARQEGVILEITAIEIQPDYLDHLAKLADLLFNVKVTRS
jgi:type I restriction-modification system DNA methylase subunit